jgi:hypothetical protein
LPDGGLDYHSPRHPKHSEVADFFVEYLLSKEGARTAAPPPLGGRAPGSNEPSGPRRREQGRGPHRSRRQPTPLPGLRCMELVLCVAPLRRGVPPR